jgi:hypothetical protein
MEKKQIDYAELGQERIITVSDLIVEIIRRLWFVILMAVVFAVLLGGYKYVKDIKEASVEQTDTDISDAESELTEDELKEVNNVLLMQDNLCQQQEYTENSVLMQINPYNESTVVLQYHFETEQSEETIDYSNDLLSSYQNYVNDGALASDLAKKGEKLDIQYLAELISFTSDSNGENGVAETITWVSGKSFEIKVIHADEDACQALALKVNECMEEYQRVLQETLGEHSLILVGNTYSRVVDKSLWSYKYDRANSIVAMQEKIDTLKDKMSEQQLEAFEKSSKQIVADQQEENAETEQTSVRVSKKYVAAGGLCGILLACILLVVLYVLRGTINKAEDIQYLYNLRILGELNASDRKNIFLIVWNRILGKKGTALTVEEEEQLFMSNLKISCEKNGIQKLLINGNGQQNTGWMESVKKELCQTGVEVIIEDDIFHSPDTFEKLKEIDYVVLVEKIRNSRYEDIVGEIRICMEQQIEILGAVVVG